MLFYLKERDFLKKELLLNTPKIAEPQLIQRFLRFVLLLDDEKIMRMLILDKENIIFNNVNLKYTVSAQQIQKMFLPIDEFIKQKKPQKIII